MLVCNHLHVKSFEESTYTPAILSPRNENRKPLISSTNLTHEQNDDSKAPYQMWIELAQRLRDRTATLHPSSEGTLSAFGRQSYSISQQTSPSLGIRREKTWAGHDSISPWHNVNLNSNKQVVTLINHYSDMLSAENNERFTEGFNGRPKSILRPMGSPSKFRLSKEVTFATN
jgi:hypothetical protein